MSQQPCPPVVKTRELRANFGISSPRTDDTVPRTFRVCGTLPPSSGGMRVDCRLFNATGYQATASTSPATSNNGYDATRRVWWVTFSDAGSPTADVVVSVEAILVGGPTPLPLDQKDNVTITGTPKIVVQVPSSGQMNLARNFEVVFNLALNHGITTLDWKISDENANKLDGFVVQNPGNGPGPWRTRVRNVGPGDHRIVEVTATHPGGTTNASAAEFHVV